MDDLASLPLWPDTVDAFYADRACSIRSAATLNTWSYTYRWLQGLHPDKSLGGFRTDDLVAFVTQRGWDTPRWAQHEPSPPGRPLQRREPDVAVVAHDVAVLTGRVICAAW
jgi:hypothetical protein